MVELAVVVTQLIAKQISPKVLPVASMATLLVRLTAPFKMTLAPKPGLRFDSSGSNPPVAAMSPLRLTVCAVILTCLASPPFRLLSLSFPAALPPLTLMPCTVIESAIEAVAEVIVMLPASPPLASSLLL